MTPRKELIKAMADELDRLEFNVFTTKAAEICLDAALAWAEARGLKMFVPVRATDEMIQQVADHYFMSDKTIALTYDLLLAAAPDVLGEGNGRLDVPGIESAWDNVRGAAPDCTGGLSSEDFVRQHRDEWDRSDADYSALAAAPDVLGDVG